MQKLDILEVLLEENAFGAVRPVKVVADVPISALVPALVEELNLPRTDLFGKELVYTLRQSSGGRVLPPNSTLIAAGIGPGTRLVLDSSMISSPMYAPLPQHPSDLALHSAATMEDVNGLVALGRGGGGDTPDITPVLKKERKGTRRAFLMLGGAALGVAGSGLGFAAYNAWVTGTLQSLITNLDKTTIQQTPFKQPAITTKPTLPTVAQAIFTFTSHTRIVRSVSWSPDGLSLASGGDDARVFVWGVGGQISQTLFHPAPVLALAWAPDSQRLVTGSNNRVTFYEAPMGKMLARPAPQHFARITSLAWAAHNAMQVVSGADDARAIVWNTTNYHSEQVFARHTAPINAVTWASDGQTVASSSQGGVVRVWSAAGGQEVHGLYLDAQVSMRAAAFAPMGMQLSVGGDDGVVRIWNGATCQQQGNGRFGNQCMDVPQRLQVSNTSVRTLAWSPDAGLLAIGTADGMLSVWSPAHSQKPLLTVQQQNIVHSVTWSPDGKQLATAAGTTVTIWKLR